MTATILDGKALAATIKGQLAARVTSLKANGIAPGLGTVLVGDDPGSISYVAGKHRDCQEVGINSIRVDLKADASQADVLAAIKDLNNAKECTGYIVQLPLPKGINTQVILESIDPAKDADGLHPINLGRLVSGFVAPLPCTPRGIVELINHYKIPLAGAEVVVIGRGLTVGRPLGLLLTRKQENATVTLTHTGTKDLLSHTKRADIVIAAIGSAHFLKASDIKQGAVVIDVGISRTSAGLLGDVDPGVMNVASFVAPMPGGVGPMTRAMLLQNRQSLGPFSENGLGQYAVRFCGGMLRKWSRSMARWRCAGLGHGGRSHQPRRGGPSHRVQRGGASPTHLHQPYLAAEGSPAAGVAPLLHAHAVAGGYVGALAEAEGEGAVGGGLGRDVEGELVAHPLG